MVYILSLLKRAEYHSDNDVLLSATHGREVGSGEGDKEVVPVHGLALLGEVDDCVGNEGNFCGAAT